MPAVPAAQPAALLTGWEVAAVLPATARSAALLWQLGQVDAWDTALDLPIGAHTALAAAAFIDRFAAEADIMIGCRACGEQLEATLDLGMLAEASAPDREGHATAVATSTGSLTVRTPTTRDLMATADEPESVAALLSRCLRRADGRALDDAEIAALTAQDLAAIDAAAEELAGPAGAAVAAQCPRCGAQVRASIDVGALLWDQVATSARQLLADVATLARAFSWSEQAVLALSPTRRAAYLALIEGDPEQVFA